MDVFVESNWVYACCMPRYRRTQRGALELLARAARGECRLYLPAICLREGAAAIRQKEKPRIYEELRTFREWAHEQGLIDEIESAAVIKFFETHVRVVGEELRQLDQTIDELAQSRGVETFALDDEMLVRAIGLRSELKVPLKPFDEAILAAVLVRRQRLADADGQPAIFCTLDSDLQPWDRNRHPKPDLTALYAAAQIQVYGDFAAGGPMGG